MLRIERQHAPQTLLGSMGLSHQKEPSRRTVLGADVLGRRRRGNAQEISQRLVGPVRPDGRFARDQQGGDVLGPTLQDRPRQPLRFLVTGSLQSVDRSP